MATYSEARLKRSLGLLEATMIGLGATIGPTIFVVPGTAFRLAGPAAVFTFVLAGIVTLFTALNYAAMSALIPEAGGGYSFASKAFRGPLAFSSGWLMWTGNVAYLALSAFTFALAVGYFFPWLSPLPVAVAAILFFSLINFLGAKGAGRTEAMLTVLVLALLAGFVTINLPHIEVSNYNPLTPYGALPMFTAIGYVYSIYIGFEVIANVIEETKRGPLVIPKAMLLTILSSMILFPLVMATIIGVIPGEVIVSSSAPLVEGMRQRFGPQGGFIMVIGMILASLATLNAAMIASTRTVFALGRDGRVPRIFMKIHGKFRTPFLGLALSSLTAIALVSSSSVDFMVYVTDYGYLLGLVIINASAISLQRRGYGSQAPRKFSSLVIPVVATITSIAAATTLRSEEVLVGLALTAFGLGIYLIYGRFKSRVRGG